MSPEFRIIVSIIFQRHFTQAAGFPAFPDRDADMIFAARFQNPPRNKELALRAFFVPIAAHQDAVHIDICLAVRLRDHKPGRRRVGVRDIEIERRFIKPDAFLARRPEVGRLTLVFGK